MILLIIPTFASILWILTARLYLEKLSLEVVSGIILLFADSRENYSSKVLSWLSMNELHHLFVKTILLKLD